MHALHVYFSFRPINLQYHCHGHSVSRCYGHGYMHCITVLPHPTRRFPPTVLNPSVDSMGVISCIGSCWYIWGHVHGCFCLINDLMNQCFGTCPFWRQRGLIASGPPKLQTLWIMVNYVLSHIPQKIYCYIICCGSHSVWHSSKIQILFCRNLIRCQVRLEDYFLILKLRRESTQGVMWM